jgi:hypothetical protein
MAFKDRLGGAALEQRSRALDTLGSPAGAESGEKLMATRADIYTVINITA